MKGKPAATVMLAGLLLGAWATGAQANSATHKAKTGVPTVETASGPQQVWPEPPEYLDGWDWVQLTSGEWLKGEVVGFYEKELEFDSDKLDNMKLDWDDIERVHTSKSMSIRFDGGETITGPVVITADEVLFASPVNIKRARHDLISMSAAGEREIDLWRINVKLGGVIKQGNLDERSYDTSLALTRRSALSRYFFTYQGVMDETQDVRTEESHRASARYDRFLALSYYWTPLYLEYYRDRFQNIEHRITAGIFAGYWLADSKKLYWSVSGGPGYQYLEYVTAPVGDELTDETPVFIATTELEYDITSEITYSIDYSAQLIKYDAGRYNHNLQTGISIDLTTRLDLDITYGWERTSRPQADAEGVKPEKDDYRLTLGLGWDF